MISFKKFVEENRIDETLIVPNKGKSEGQAIILLGGAGCFDGETMVKTETGSKPIDKIKVGDMVYTMNEITNEIELQPVIGTNPQDKSMVFEEMLELTFDDGSIVRCTENHEFFIDNEWVKAKDI